MKPKSIMALSGLALLATQAWAQDPAIADAQTITTPSVAKVATADSQTGATTEGLSRPVLLAQNHASSGANSKKADVVTTEGGVQYLTIHADDGVKQTDANFVVCQPCRSGKGVSGNPSGSSRGCCPATGCN